MWDSIKLNKNLLFKVLFIGLILFLFFKQIYHDWKLTRYGVYTIGELLDVEATTGSKRITYEYYFQGDTLVGTNANGKLKKSMIGNYYLVKVLSNSPQISELLENYKFSRIPDTIPLNGWIKPPKKKRKNNFN